MPLFEHTSKGRTPSNTYTRISTPLKCFTGEKTSGWRWTLTLLYLLICHVLTDLWVPLDCLPHSHFWLHASMHQSNWHKEWQSMGLLQMRRFHRSSNPLLFKMSVWTFSLKRSKSLQKRPCASSKPQLLSPLTISCWHNQLSLEPELLHSLLTISWVQNLMDFASPRAVRHHLQKQSCAPGCSASASHQWDGEG